MKKKRKAAGKASLDSRLSVQQRNALGFVRDGEPFAGCVTANQRTGRQMTLWSLASIGLVRSNPWSLTVYGQEWLYQSNARPHAERSDSVQAVGQGVLREGPG